MVFHSSDSIGFGSEMLIHCTCSSQTTPILKHLNWLLVQERICFKILLITYCALKGLAPGYTVRVKKKGNPSLTQNISKLIKDVTTLISVGDSIVILLSFDRLFIHLLPRMAAQQSNYFVKHVKFASVQVMRCLRCTLLPELSQTKQLV